MKEAKSNVESVVIAIIIAVVVLGGGAYYFQKNASAPQVTVETPATQKSLEEYFATRDQFLNSEMTKDPSELGFKELANVAVTCPDSLGTPCAGNLLVLSKDSIQSGNQEFYLAFTMGTGYKYYGPFTDDLQKIVDESKSIKSLERSDVTETPKAVEGFETYESNSLGLSFSYPSSSSGNEVSVKEALNSDQNGEIGSVSLMSNGSVIASISVEWRDSPGATIEGILLGDSKTCNLEIVSETSGKTVYGFKTSTSPYSDEFDPNCQILSQVYAFSAQPNKFAVVGTGQTPPFSAEDTNSFFDSIKLFQ